MSAHEILYLEVGKNEIRIATRKQDERKIRNRKWDYKTALSKESL